MQAGTHHGNPRRTRDERRMRNLPATCDQSHKLLSSSKFVFSKGLEKGEGNDKNFVQPTDTRREKGEKESEREESTNGKEKRKQRERRKRRIRGEQRTEKEKTHLGGALSPRNDLQSLSASLRVIIPHLLEDTGIAPARRSISN